MSWESSVGWGWIKCLEPDKYSEPNTSTLFACNVPPLPVAVLATDSVPKCVVNIPLLRYSPIVTRGATISIPLFAANLIALFASKRVLFVLTTILDAVLKFITDCEFKLNRQAFKFIRSASKFICPDAPNSIPPQKTAVINIPIHLRIKPPLYKVTVFIICAMWYPGT